MIVYIVLALWVLQCASCAFLPHPHSGYYNRFQLTPGSCDYKCCDTRCDECTSTCMASISITRPATQNENTSVLRKIHCAMCTIPYTKALLLWHFPAITMSSGTIRHFHAAPAHTRTCTGRPLAQRVLLACITSASATLHAQRVPPGGSWWV